MCIGMQASLRQRWFVCGYIKMMLDIIVTGQASLPDWLATQDADLKRMLEPNADLRLAAVRPVRILLDRAARAGK